MQDNEIFSYLDNQEVIHCIESHANPNNAPLSAISNPPRSYETNSCMCLVLVYTTYILTYDDMQTCVLYEGCVICEVRDHRGKVPGEYEKQLLLLRPTLEVTFYIFAWHFPFTLFFRLCLPLSARLTMK